MAHDDIKLVYQRFAEAVNRRDLDALDDIFDPQLVNHGADPAEPLGAYHFEQVFRNLVDACSDLRVTIEDQIAEGDKVAVRWSDIGTHTGGSHLGVPATGKQIILTGIDILRIRDGRVVERWSESDKQYAKETLGVERTRLE